MAVRQFNQFVVLALFDTALLDGGLGKVALLQQAQRLHPLLDPHPLGQPRLPVPVSRIDGILRRQHFR